MRNPGPRATTLLLLSLLALLPMEPLAAADSSTTDGVPPASTAPQRTLLAPRSGITYQAPDTQALQQDDFSNPGMLAVDQGRALYSAGDRSCAGCHGEAETALKGVAARYPKFTPRVNHLLNLEQRINLCRIEHQRALPWRWESPELLGITAFVAHQSRGRPFAARIDGPAKPYFEQGQAYYYQRRGQLNLGCQHCHEQNAGRYLRGDILSQGHGNGYPIYRLDWQATGSLHRRLRFCNEGVRANQLPFGDERYVALELFLAWRADKLPIETPAVRR